MNLHTFSILGYLSVLLWLAAPLLWFLRSRLRIPRWPAIAVAVLSLVFATINSRTHVNRIESEQIEETTNQLDAAAAKRKNVEKARSGDVADIRFAEDGNNDFIDKAGMGDADRKYVDTIDGSAEPDWKKNKKQRGASEDEDASLDDTLGGKEAIAGVTSETLQDETKKRTPIIMSEANKTTANRLDKINLNFSRLIILLVIILICFDYLTHMNSYARASLPLPVPASWRNAFTTLPAIVHRPDSPRRTLSEELAWIVRRGDVFVCFTKDASTLPDSLPPLGKLMRPVDLLRVEGDRISDSFVFESLWYGRSCFVVDRPERIRTLFSSICHELEKRYVTRARAVQNIHLVWNSDQQLNQDDLAKFENLARTAGVSLFLCPEPIT